MIQKRFWNLKKGQCFRLDGWDSLLRKYDWCDFTFASESGAGRLLFGIAPWTRIECDPADMCEHRTLDLISESKDESGVTKVRRCSSCGIFMKERISVHPPLKP